MAQHSIEMAWNMSKIAPHFTTMVWNMSKTVQKWCQFNEIDHTNDTWCIVAIEEKFLSMQNKCNLGSLLALLSSPLENPNFL